MYSVFTRVFGASLSLAALVVVSPLRAQSQMTHGIDLSTLDRSVKPDTDFYRFANGAWLDKTAIPADKPAMDAFTEITLRNEAVLQRVVEKAAAESDLPAGSEVRKIGDFYRVGMDEARAESLGVKPLEPLFHRIDALSDRSGILREIARLNRIGVSALFSGGLLPDLKDSRRRIFTMAQGGISLPDRDYYLNDDPMSKTLREKYVVYLQKSFVLAGETSAQAGKDAADVLDLETRLAKASRSRVQMRDVNGLYHKLDLKGLEALSPALDWGEYFREIGMGSPGDINVATPEYFQEVDKMLGEVSLTEWKAYLRQQTLSAFAPYLNRAFSEEGFRFSSLLTGQKEQRPRWRRVLDTTEGVMGEAVGKLYVAEAFSPAAKQRAYTMILDLKAALRDRIEALDWMSAQTKVEALKKLDTLQIKVGYPDKWKSYAGLEVRADSYVQNVMRANEFAFKQELKKVGKPVDRTEWSMTPPTVNAYYNPLYNEIVFPAGILQAPFFDVNADDASNYGAIGAVIGHEMTHGFDDQGRQFDSAGNLRDWWTAEDGKHFKERADALIRQYSAYIAVGEVKVNGALTQGENIADLGGLNIAYQAWKRTWKNGAAPGAIEGFTSEQRFFLAFAQIWRFKSSLEYSRLLAQVDAHSPAYWRVMGTLVNFPPFVEAFGPGSSTSVARPGSGSIRIW